MVEHERSVTGGMPNGRIMMASIFRHFQLERDRIGVLGERSLLNLKLAGQSVADLEAFRDKYQYVLSAIPIDELPKERTLFNHLVDELSKCTAMKSKVDKAIEASGSSHRRSTSWLWAKVRNAIDLDQQKRNRDGFEKNLKLKPTVLTSTTSQKDDVPANPAETKKKRGQKAGKKEEKPAAKSTAPAAPAPSGKPPGGPPPKAKPKGKQGGDLTPRSNAVSKTAKMTPAEKAKVPCMFFAYNCCYAKQCVFSHDPNKKSTRDHRPSPSLKPRGSLRRPRLWPR